MEIEKPVIEEVVTSETIAEKDVEIVTTEEDVKVEPIIPLLSDGHFALMEHNIKPLSEVEDKESIVVLKEIEFKTESIDFNPTLKEIFAFVQDDNEIMTKAVAVSVVKDSSKLDSSKLFQTGVAKFYKLKV